jgi:hypothetical protein
MIANQGRGFQFEGWSIRRTWALLVNKAEDPVDMLFIVDDRDNPRKADQEIAVLGDLGHLPTAHLI